MKSRADYVSRTDLAAQEAAISVIEEYHPNHLILAEESDESLQDQLARWDGRPLWIVDPLDGTANFLHNHPHYCSSIALAVDGRPVVGAVTSAPSGERWWAAEGIGAFKNGKPISVSEEYQLIHSMAGTGFPFKLLDVLPEYLEEFDRVLRATSGIRRGGSAALDLCYLARARLMCSGKRYLCRGILRPDSSSFGKRVEQLPDPMGASWDLVQVRYVVLTVLSSWENS